jgi:hypothetical protein
VFYWPRPQFAAGGIRLGLPDVTNPPNPAHVISRSQSQ